MNDTLRMNQNIYPFRWKTKKIMCLNHLESFIHERCRINADLPSHTPAWVVECILWLHVIQLFNALASKGSTRSSEYDSPYIRFFASFNALENSAMFTIHRKYFNSLFFCFFSNNSPCHHKGFFVCQPNRLLRTYGRHCWYQPGSSNNCRKDKVGIFITCSLGNTIIARKYLERSILSPQSSLQFFCSLLRSNSYNFGRKGLYLFFNETDVFPCSQCNNPEPIPVS